MIDKVIDNLYLGDVQDVINEDRVGLLKMDLKITHILTVAAEGISVEKQIDGICYMFIYAFDIATQDMFAGNLLANSITYISTSTETSNGRALVHCEAGISRSVFIVAAYLMQKFQWSAAKAVEYIQTIRPIAQPNDGFIRQLRIFESCHFVADIQTVSQSSLYKKWLLDISSADRNSLCITFDMDEKSPDSVDSMSVKYRCRKCRKILFSDRCFTRHKILISHNVTGDVMKEPVDCGFDYLISPMTWMSLKEHRGKIFCSCSEKLGHYDWGGRVCKGVNGKQCGTAVRPWIYVNRNKIDRVVEANQNVRGLMDSIIIRPPKLPHA